MQVQPCLLIVEDDADICDTLQLLLEYVGYQVTLAHDLTQASAALDTETFQLVLTDFFSHHLDQALIMAQDLQAHAFPTPVAILTGYRVPANHPKFQRFAFVLEKPFELQDLLVAIATTLIG